MSRADSNVRDWLRSQTQVAFPQPLSEGPAHCLQGLYPSGILCGRLQIPAFIYGETVRSYPDWLMSDLEETARKKLDLLTELFNQVSALLPKDEKSDGEYHRLSNRASDLEKQIERQERSIDRRFKAQDPLTGEQTSTVAEANRLLIHVDAILSNHPSDVSFGSTLDDQETEDLRWSLYAELRGGEVSGPEVEEVLSEEYHSVYFRYGPSEVRRKPRVPLSSETVYDVHSPSGLKVDVDDLLRTRKRACVEIPTYDCGLSHLPADATVLEVQRICRAYFERLESKAFRAGNTHALLCFHLHHLRRALRAHNLYDDLDRYTEELERQIQAEIDSRSQGGAPPKMGPGEEMADRKQAVRGRLRKKKNWHTKGRHRGKPKWKKIARELREEEGDLVKGRGDLFSISPERISQQVDEWDDIKLDEIRKDLDVSEPQ